MRACGEENEKTRLSEQFIYLLSSLKPTSETCKKRWGKEYSGEHINCFTRSDLTVACSSFLLCHKTDTCLKVKVLVVWSFFLLHEVNHWERVRSTCRTSSVLLNSWFWVHMLGLLRAVMFPDLWWTLPKDVRGKHAESRHSCRVPAFSSGSPWHKYYCYALLSMQ